MTPDERRLADRRTLAMRGPGPGGPTPQQSQAASNPCLNCGTNVQLEYCPECGQRASDPDPTLAEFLHDLGKQFLNWDGKFITTFRMLVAKPGALTCEYLAGKRVRYISPLRVYLSCGLLFLFALAVVPQAPIVITRNGITTRIAPLGTRDNDSTATVAAVNARARQGGQADGLWASHYENALRHSRELAAQLAAAIPKVMFVLVPLFAALVMLVLRQCRRRFPQHLAFALHVHAFLFLMLTLMLVRRFTGVIPVHVAIELVGSTAIGVYLVRSMRTVYEVTTGTAIARSAIIAVSYFLVFCIAMLATFALIVLVQF